MTKTTPSESEVQREIQLAASRVGGRLFRNNVGLFYTKNGTPTRCGLCVGSADLIGWRPLTITADMVGATVAQFWSVEVKRPRGPRAKEHQERWRDTVRSAGGTGSIARSVEQLISDLKDAVCRLTSMK